MTKSTKTAATARVVEPALSKLDQLAALVTREGGASLADLMAVTSWQAHSVRGALAGALKRRGLAIVSRKTDAVRIYSVAPADL